MIIENTNVCIFFTMAGEVGRNMKKKNFRFLALVLVVIFSLVACQQSISHEGSAVGSVGEVESDSSHITESPSLVEPVVEDGLAIWRFIPEKQPAVTIGVVIPENLQFLISSWQSDWEALNRYLWEEEGYQVALIAIGVLDEDSALERQAVQTCMDEEIDLFSCAPLDFAVLPATDQFLDLGQEPYKQELSSIFEHYPEPYWEYVETLYGGIYSVSHAISLGGHLGFNLYFQHERLDPLGLTWNAEELVGNTLEDWENTFVRWQEEGGKTFSVMKIASISDSFLNYLAPETDYQMVAPGVGIHLATGEVEKILETEVVQERIQLFQKWIDQGYVLNSEANDSLLRSFHNAAGPAAARGVILPQVPEEESRASQSYTESCDYTVFADKPLYYPVNVDENCFFTGILAESKQIDRALSFLSMVGSDAKLRTMLCGEGTFLYFLLYSWMLDEINDTLLDVTYYNKAGEVTTMAEANYESYEQALISPVTGFRFDPQNVAEEVQAVEAVYAQSPARRNSPGAGEYNNVTFTEDLKQLEADMEAAGVDSIVAEVTRQLEAWKAAQ